MMSGALETWLVPIAILLAFGALLLGPLLEAASDAFTKRRFHCSVAGEDVMVEFRERAGLGTRKRLDVVSCSAFADATAISCGKDCLEVELAAAR